MRKEEARQQLQLFFHNAVTKYDLRKTEIRELKNIFRTTIKRTVEKNKQKYGKLKRKTIHEAEQEVKTYQYNMAILPLMLEVFDEEFDKFIMAYHVDLKEVIVNMKQKMQQEEQQLTLKNEGYRIGE